MHEPMATGEALYERYKDALKRGHVAALRGRTDEALAAYGEAAAIAPERPTPHTSAGTALLRRGRFTEAQRSYEVALALAPRDETALLGRAQALAAQDRRPEAANAFDALAEHRATGGQLADAVDAARRGLELAEGRDRRRTLERLITHLRATEPDEPARLALERALRVLEGVAMATPLPSPPIPGEATPVPGAPASPGSEVQPQPRPAPAGALDRDLPAEVDPDDLARTAEAALDAGDTALAVGRLLDLAAANRTRGRGAAALDACYLALSLDPDHLDLHLALAQLYDEQRWAGLAGEKLDLLDRLVALDGDPAAAARVAAARAARTG